MKLKSKITNNQSSLIDNQSKRPSTTVEIALQIHSILTNKPNFMRFSPENDDLTKNKPNSNQFVERAKLMQSVYLQRIMKIYANMGKKNKANSKPISMHITLKTKPKQTQFQDLILPQKAKINHNLLPIALFPLTSSTVPDYNRVFSQISCSQRTLFERSWK